MSKCFFIGNYVVSNTAKSSRCYDVYLCRESKKEPPYTLIDNNVVSVIAAPPNGWSGAICYGLGEFGVEGPWYKRFWLFLAQR